MGLAGLLGSGSGGFLGAAAVELVADTRPLVAGLETAKGETAAASKTMSNETKSASGVMVASYAIAGAAVAAFAISSVKAAEAHQVALARLAAVAGANTDAFVKLADAQSRLTGFTETDILTAEKSLAVLHLTAQQMSQLLPLVEDYARFSGRDIPDAAALVEKAILGNAKAIKELGVRFKDTHSQAGNLAEIMGIMNSTVKGTAAAFAGTYAGQVQKFSAAVENLKVAIGDHLLPVLTQFTEAATADIEILQGHFDDLGHSIAANLSLPLQILSFFVPSFKSAADAIGAFVHPTKAAASAAGDLAAGATDAAAASTALTVAQKAAAAAAKAQKQSEDALKGGLLGLVSAQAQLVADQKTLNDLRKQGKQGTVDYSNAELQLLQDQLGLTQSTRDYLNNLHRSGDTQKQVIGQILAMGKAVGLTKDQIDKLLAAYLNAWGQINAHPLGAHVTPGGFLQGKLTGGSGYGGSSGGATVHNHNTNVSVHVAGSVTTQSDLVKAIQTSLLRQKARNAGVLGL